MTRYVGPIDQARLNQVQLDWVAYFYKFVELHGEPVMHRGRLLFPDGWGYSSTDYAGPEYPPPGEDEYELIELRQVYWTVYRTKLEGEYAQLKTHLEMLEEWSGLTSQPLQGYMIFAGRTDEGAAVLNKSETGDVDVEGIRQRMQDLENLLAVCDEQLTELKELIEDD